MTENEVGKPLLPEHYSVVLTSNRGTEGKRRQFLFVVLSGKLVGLTYGPFVLLLQLAKARFETHAGYLCLPPQSDPESFRLAVHRLRSQISACLGSQAGLNWVQTGLTTEYRLTVDASEIAVDASFKQLPRALVSNDLREFLVEHCPEVTLGNLAATTVKLQ